MIYVIARIILPLYLVLVIIGLYRTTALFAVYADRAMFIECVKLSFIYPILILTSKGRKRLLKGFKL